MPYIIYYIFLFPNIFDVKAMLVKAHMIGEHIGNHIVKLFKTILLETVVLRFPGQCWHPTY